MIKEFATLLHQSFPRSSDSRLRTYLHDINKDTYTLKILEKDFLLTGLLGYIDHQLPELSFKWWTCLNKIYFHYFRLSEDLDFTISTEDEIVNTANKRKIFARKCRNVMYTIAQTMWWELSPDETHHRKAQWNRFLQDEKYTYLHYEFSYKSLFGDTETIKIECTYTHHQLLDSVRKPIQSIYTDLIDHTPIFADQSIQCLDITEMIAEKTRAALTRQVPVIRDFYDLRYLCIKHHYQLEEHIDLIRLKCDESDKRRTIQHFAHPQTAKEIDTLPYLRSRILFDLLPVLSSAEFDLDTIYNKLSDIYLLVSHS